MYNKDDIILIDIGCTNIRIGLLGKEIQSPCVIIKTPIQKEELLSVLEDKISEIAKMKRLKNSIVAISCPGLINSKGIVKKSLYVPLTGVNLAQEIETKTSIKTIVLNDAKVQALGRYNSKNLLYMNIGTAIGGAYVFKNQLFLGADGYACEFGHIFIGNDLKCVCGRRGCLDTIASGKSFISEFGEGWWKKAEDIKIKQKIEAAGYSVGKALAQASILFNPKEICVTGNICSFAIFQNCVKKQFDKDSWYEIPILFSNNSWENVYLGLKKIIKECMI